MPNATSKTKVGHNGTAVHDGKKHTEDRSKGLFFSIKLTYEEKPFEPQPESFPLA